MQRHEMIAAMGGLGLKGMAGAFDEAVTTGAAAPAHGDGDPDRPACRPRPPIATPPRSATA